jgi:DNA-binding NarL/FixJ family response regulator
MNPHINSSVSTSASSTPPSKHHLGDTVPVKKAAPARRPLHVFVVEDEAFMRERVIEKIAASRAKIVEYADSAAAAIAKLRELPCDVIILDLELKQGTGFQVLREVRGNGNSRPWIIVFTNFSDAHFRKQTIALGADFFVDKAQGLDRLGEIIDGLPLPNGGEST